MIKGRMSRLPFLGYQVLSYFLIIVAIIILGEQLKDYELFAMACIIVAWIISFYSVIKRLRDINKSAWYSLILIFPLMHHLLVLILLFIPSKDNSIE